MKLLILALGPPAVASSRTRVFAYLPWLDRAAVRYDLLIWQSNRFIKTAARSRVPLTEHLLNRVRRLWVLVQLLGRAPSAHTVYVQKVILPWWVLIALKAAGRRIVFDFDDALYALAPGDEHGFRGSVRRWRTRKFERMLKTSDLVMIENDANRDYAEQFCRETVTITGPIDTDRYRPSAPRSASTVVLGWIGSPSTTGYLELLRPVLTELAQQHSLVLHLIGAGTFELAGVDVRRTSWTLETEVDALATFDIGLMPLTDDGWSRGKGGYKILQYMAMGIPTVASPVGINCDMVEDGVTGFLASDAGQWRSALEQLIVDPARRQAIGACARRRAIERYSLERYVPTILRALARVEISQTGEVLQ